MQPIASVDITSNLTNLATVVGGIGTNVSDSLANVIAEVAAFGEYRPDRPLIGVAHPCFLGVYTVFSVLSIVLYTLVFVTSSHRTQVCLG